VAIGLYSLSGGIQKDPAKVAMRARHMVPASLATPAQMPAQMPDPKATPDTAQPPSEHRP
jgi:hypothetical protein